MAYVPCDWFYENVLGDSCNGKCEDCFGDKDIRICIQDFEVVGETILDKVIIEKGSWWECRFENEDHVLLFGCDNHELRLCRELYDKNFKHFIYNDIK